MELVFFRRYYEGKYPKEEITRIDFPGNGLLDDPIIVNSTEKLPRNFTLRDTDRYIVVNECNFRESEYGIIFESCKNVEIINCNFRDILFLNCANSSLSNCTASNLYLTETHDMSISDCKIKGLYLNVSYKNQFNNCSLDKVINKSSRGNIFVNNSIPEKYIQKILGTDKTKRQLKRIILFTIIGIIAALIVTLMIFEIFNPTMDFFMLVLLLVVLVIIMIPIPIYGILTSKYYKKGKDLKKKEQPNVVK